MSLYALLRAAAAGRAARPLARHASHIRLHACAAKPPPREEDADGNAGGQSQEQATRLEDMFKTHTTEGGESAKHKFVDEDGQSVFEFDANASPDEDDFDWSRFEDTFGLVGIRESVEKLDDDEISKFFTEEHISDASARSVVEKANKSCAHTPPDLDQILKQGEDDGYVKSMTMDEVKEAVDKHTRASQQPGRPEEKVQSKRTVTTATPHNPAQPGVSDGNTPIHLPPPAVKRDDAHIPESTNQRPRAQTLRKHDPRYAPDGVTRKLGRTNTRRAHPSPQHKSRPPSPVAPRAPQRAAPVADTDRAALSELSLRLPETAKRRATPWRQRTLEAEMERIAAPVLCGADSPWRRAGGVMSHALLSANGHTLAVQYSRLRGARCASAEARRAWDTECKRACGAVRAALARSLHVKRVPRVVLEYSPEVTIDRHGAVGEEGGNADLDTLFGRIAEERATASSA